jgi:hypothetical protein
MRRTLWRVPHGEDHANRPRNVLARERRASRSPSPPFAPPIAQGEPAIRRASSMRKCRFGYIVTVEVVNAPICVLLPRNDGTFVERGTLNNIHIEDRSRYR